MCDIPLKPKYGKVHLFQTDSYWILHNAIEGDSFIGIALHVFNEMRRLHKNGAQTIGRVDNAPMLRFNNIDDDQNEGRRCEKYAAVMRFVTSKFCK